MSKNNIWTIKGDKSGPTVAIFGGVHGDEKAGVATINYLRDNLVLNRGTVYLVLVNPPAITEGARMLNKNINRCFSHHNTGKTPEDIRARELMSLLDKCDALLDLHEHSNEATDDFIICEPPSFRVAKSFGVPLISYGWSSAEPGATDGYMYEQGKIGICYEAGCNTKTKRNTQRHKIAAKYFLSAFNMINLENASSPEKFSFVKVSHSIYKKSDTLDRLILLTLCPKAGCLRLMVINNT
jgi:predicted deacylase